MAKYSDSLPKLYANQLAPLVDAVNSHNVEVSDWLKSRKPGEKSNDIRTIKKLTA